MDGLQGKIEGVVPVAADTRLIERWLPIAALGEESVRERRSMTALPPTYYLACLVGAAALGGEPGGFAGGCAPCRRGPG